MTSQNIDLQELQILLNSLAPGGGGWLQFQIMKCQTDFTDEYHKYFPWNSYQVYTKTPRWSLVNSD